MNLLYELPTFLAMCYFASSFLQNDQSGPYDIQIRLLSAHFSLVKLINFTVGFHYLLVLQKCFFNNTEWVLIRFIR